MSWLRARDYSQYQGDVDFTREPIDIALIKMSGGDAGLYYDSKASQNYGRAVAAGKGVMGWHFAGATDPVAEAQYAVRAMQPFAVGDVYGLDWEVAHPNPPAWVLQYAQTVKSLTGKAPIIYMNGSTANAWDWSPVFAICGFWVAWWGISPDANVPVKYPYIIQQYDDTGTVVSNGVRVDEDAVFLTMDQWRAYGYALPPAPPAPSPTPTPPTPTPTPIPSEPTPPIPTAPAPAPSVPIEVTEVVGPPTPVPVVRIMPPDAPTENWIKFLVAIIAAIALLFAAGWIWLHN